MDMRRHLRSHFVTNADLEVKGGSFESIIAEVLEEEMQNRYRGQRELQPVIVFEDGKRLVPNMGIRHELIEALGEESDGWIGRRIRVFLRPVPRKSGQGAATTRFEKAAEVLEREADGAKAGQLTAADIAWR